MSLERMRCGLELKFVGDETETKVGTFTGYGAVFNNTDGGGDVILPGAFKQSLKDWKGRGKLPKMLLQHGSFLGPAEDGIPVGKYTLMEEDAKGLYLEGELFALETQKGQYIHEGLKSGELDGLSIGYIPREIVFGKKPTDPPRSLKKLELKEVSIVTFPMNDKAGVISAKSIEELDTLSDCERWLRDVVGFSQRQAVAFVSRIKSLRPSDSEVAQVAAATDVGQRLLSRIHNAMR